MSQVVFDAVYCLDAPQGIDCFSNVWKSAPKYNFSFAKDRSGIPVEGGEICFAWNEKGFYVAAEFEDSVLISKHRKDEVLHYQFSDVLELFIKPADDLYYWEMYATPFGNKSTLFFSEERAGLKLEKDFLQGHSFHGLEVCSEKSSKGWKTQMWIPVEQLTALGAEWGAEANWRIFCGRYNYNSEDLKDLELSMAPAISTTNYHLTEEYAVLNFKR